MRVVGKCDEGCDQRCPALKDPPCDHPCDADLLLSSKPGAITGGCCHTGHHSHQSRPYNHLTQMSNVINSFDLAFLCGDWAHIDSAMWPMASGTHTAWIKTLASPPCHPTTCRGKKPMRCWHQAGSQNRSNQPVVLELLQPPPLHLPYRL